MMKAGTYWVGDLCYVLDDRWDEVCDLTIHSNECLDGEFELKDGIRFSTQGTAYGDGSYPDEFDRYYDVDSGTIGCILADDIGEAVLLSNANGGHIVEFKEDFFTESVDGAIRFVGISGKCLLEINTGDIEYDEGEDWWPEEYDDEFIEDEN